MVDLLAPNIGTIIAIKKELLARNLCTGEGGKCPYGGVLETKNLCRMCVRALVARMTVLRNARIKAGMCSRCGLFESGRYRDCSRCRVKKRERVELKAEREVLSGRCRSGCGRPLATKKYCRACADKMASSQREKNRRIKGG